jgi:hypothetical protein
MYGEKMGSIATQRKRKEIRTRMGRIRHRRRLLLLQLHERIPAPIRGGGRPRAPSWSFACRGREVDGDDARTERALQDGRRLLDRRTFCFDLTVTRKCMRRTATRDVKIAEEGRSHAVLRFRLVVEAQAGLLEFKVGALVAQK